MGKSSINGPFSMAMLNNQRVGHGVLQLLCFFLNQWGLECTCNMEAADISVPNDETSGKAVGLGLEFTM